MTFRNVPYKVTVGSSANVECTGWGTWTNQTDDAVTVRFEVELRLSSGDSDTNSTSRVLEPGESFQEDVSVSGNAYQYNAGTVDCVAKAELYTDETPRESGEVTDTFEVVELSD